MKGWRRVIEHIAMANGNVDHLVEISVSGGCLQVIEGCPDCGAEFLVVPTGSASAEWMRRQVTA
jgi:hypothetical protein